MLLQKLRHRPVVSCLWLYRDSHVAAETCVLQPQHQPKGSQAGSVYKEALKGYGDRSSVLLSVGKKASGWEKHVNGSVCLPVLYEEKAMHTCMYL